MDTTDGFGGFKELDYFPNVALAVSNTDKMEVGKVHEPPAGWHWGSRAEVAAIMGGGEEARWPKKFYYWDQGGWVGCTWAGVQRTCFAFSDSLQVGGCLGTGCDEGAITELGAAELARILPIWCFAGIVCVAD